jgi:hypothetical protein
LHHRIVVTASRLRKHSRVQPRGQYNILFNRDKKHCAAAAAARAKCSSVRQAAAAAAAIASLSRDSAVAATATTAPMAIWRDESVTKHVANFLFIESMQKNVDSLRILTNDHRKI